MSVSPKDRTDAVLELAGKLLRTPGVRRFFRDHTHLGQLRVREYTTKALVVTYESFPEGMYQRLWQPARPRSLEIRFNGALALAVAWGDRGKRRKKRDEPGYWSERLRDEIGRLAEDDRF